MTSGGRATEIPYIVAWSYEDDAAYRLLHASRSFSPGTVWVRSVACDSGAFRDFRLDFLLANRQFSGPTHAGGPFRVNGSQVRVLPRELSNPQRPNGFQTPSLRPPALVTVC